MRAALIGLVMLTACVSDETLSGYGASQTLWVLAAPNGNPELAEAILQFPAAGQLVGRTPCTSFSARQTAPYPWFELADFKADEKECPTETGFFTALKSVTFSEVLDTTLILSNDGGLEMVFKADG